MTPVRLEPAAPLSRVKHSITEPLRSLKLGDGRKHHKIIQTFKKKTVYKTKRHTIPLVQQWNYLNLSKIGFLYHKYTLTPMITIKPIKHVQNTPFKTVTNDMNNSAVPFYNTPL